MKRPTELTQFTGIKMFFLAMIAFCGILLTSIKVFAQSVPEKVEVDINTNGGTAWYMQPWMWVVGVAVFIYNAVIDKNNLISCNVNQRKYNNEINS